MKKIIASTIVAVFSLLVLPSLLLSDKNRDIASASSLRQQVLPIPRLEVTLLENAGEADSGFNITTDPEFQLVSSFISGLPQIPPVQWPSLGWRGFQLFNSGVPGLPEEIGVFEGVIRIVNGSFAQYFIDANGFEQWLVFRAAQEGLSSSEGGAAESADEMPSLALVAPIAVDLPTSGSEPPYEPEKWNKPDVKNKNNCYNYARNKVLEKFGRPGRGTDKEPPLPGQPGYNCESFVAAAEADGMTKVDCDKACPEGSYKVALVLDPDGDGGKLSPDYHWYRQDKGGKWSHKPGAGEATNKDSSGKEISDPRTADRRRKTKDGWARGYRDFCGCFCVKAS